MAIKGSKVKAEQAKAPKTDGGEGGLKVPKPVVAARGKLQGEEITAENLTKFLNKAELNNLANSFRNTMTAQVKDDYSKLKSDADRRGWLAQYIIDPQTASCSGFNKTTAFNKTSSDTEACWLHQSQIAGPNYLNDPAAAAILCASGELADRASEFASLAAKGWKQFYFSMAMVRTSTGSKDENGVQADSDLQGGEFTEVKDHIVNSLGKPVQKKRPAVKEPESAEKKQRREVISMKSIAMRKCKALIDKTTNELVTIEVDLPNLTLKGYPELMIDWCKAKIQMMRDHIGVAQQVYNDEVVKVSQDSSKTEEIEADGKKIDQALQALDSSFSEWKKTAGSEVKKLIG
jgi:hypothetical protein